MISLATYPVAVVHQAMLDATSKRAVLPDGATFSRNSHRLVLFSTKGVVCSSCGLAGSFYSLETQSKDVVPHLNLYAVSPKNGAWVLMTKDHTHPKSKGGPNALENYTTMCAPCNTKKADKIIKVANETN